MKFLIENLGPIKKADIELGDLTIICGKNSTGKTYITYSLIAFFSDLKECQFSFGISEVDINKIKEKGEVSLDIEEYKAQFKNYIEVNPFLTFYLSSFLAIKHKDERFTCKIPDILINKDPYSVSRNITATCGLKASWNKKRKKIDFQLINNGEGYPTDEIIKEGISNLLKDFFIKKFISSTLNLTSFTCERTGVVIFANDLLAANFLKQTDKNTYEKVIPNEQTNKPSRYQVPIITEITNNYDFSQLHTESFLAKDYPHILTLLDDIVKGKYVFDNETNQIMFMPEGTTDVKLAMHQSSSTVRSLRSFDFFLRHQIQPHQTIVMDEPELNLHPENQRKLARLFAMLVNAGIKVMITTHSDYIIKEFNTLLMLNYKEDPRTTKLQKKYRYCSKELLDAEKVKLYIVENGTTNAVPVTQDAGMTIDSFDESIREMGIIQRDILYGGEEQ